MLSKPWWLELMYWWIIDNINLSPPGDDGVSELGQYWIGAKPLSEPMLGYCLRHTKEQTSVKF